MASGVKAFNAARNVKWWTHSWIVNEINMQTIEIFSEIDFPILCFKLTIYIYIYEEYSLYFSQIISHLIVKRIILPIVGLLTTRMWHCTSSLRVQAVVKPCSGITLLVYRWNISYIKIHDAKICAKNYSQLDRWWIYFCIKENDIISFIIFLNFTLSNRYPIYLANP